MDHLLLHTVRNPEEGDAGAEVAVVEVGPVDNAVYRQKAKSAVQRVDLNRAGDDIECASSQV